MLQMGDISPLRELAQILLTCDEAQDELPPDLLTDLNILAAKAQKHVFHRAGVFLHKLNADKQSEEQVMKAIDIFPSALSFEGDKGMLPIQRCAFHHKRMPFVPILALEGSRRHVGGKGKRGGIMLPIPGLPPSFRNMFQAIANYRSPAGYDREMFEQASLSMLDRLVALKLLRKKDVKRLNLLLHSSDPKSRKRFSFFAQYCPEALVSTKSTDLGTPLIHCSTRSINSFEMVLAEGMKYYPTVFGFLFKKDVRGTTACELAISMLGKEQVLACIKRCIPPTDNHPILHSVATHVPQYKNDFTMHYPDATQLRDASGRLLFHSELSSGTKSFSTDAVFFSSASNQQISEIDPVTGLYPFMLAAVDKVSDISSVYKLLSRNPLLIDRQMMAEMCHLQDQVSRGMRQQQLSRKRKLHERVRRNDWHVS